LTVDYEKARSELIAEIGLAGRWPLEEPRPKSKGYVLISYAEEDAAFVQLLATFLREHEYGLWEFKSGDRDYSGNFYEELESVIKNAAATLSVISPDWKNSTVAKQEFLFSKEIGTPVFFLRVSDPRPTLALAGVPFIDFSVGNDEAFAKLDRELQRRGL
jgi:hypothetical protein